MPGIKKLQITGRNVASKKHDVLNQHNGMKMFMKLLYNSAAKCLLIEANALIKVLTFIVYGSTLWPLLPLSNKLTDGILRKLRIDCTITFRLWRFNQKRSFDPPKLTSGGWWVTCAGCSWIKVKCPCCESLCFSFSQIHSPGFQMLLPRKGTQLKPSPLLWTCLALVCYPSLSICTALLAIQGCPPLNPDISESFLFASFDWLCKPLFIHSSSLG